jgi:hypothetical protein
MTRPSAAAAPRRPIAIALLPSRLAPARRGRLGPSPLPEASAPASRMPAATQVETITLKTALWRRVGSACGFNSRTSRSRPAR